MRYQYRVNLWEKLKELGEVAVSNYSLPCGLSCAVWLPKRSLALFDGKLSRRQTTLLHEHRVNYRVRPSIGSLAHAIKVSS